MAPLAAGCLVGGFLAVTGFFAAAAGFFADLFVVLAGFPVVFFPLADFTATALPAGRFVDALDAPPVFAVFAGERGAFFARDTPLASEVTLVLELAFTLELFFAELFVPLCFGSLVVLVRAVCFAFFRRFADFF